MGTQVFPSLPGLDIAVTRETIYKTQTYESASGKEQRTSWWSTPRYRYSLSFNVLRDTVSAPAPWGGYGEAGVVLKFLDDHTGSFDSFVYADPYDGVSRQVRFEADTLAIRRVVDQWWECSFKLLSVK